METAQNQLFNNPKGAAMNELVGDAVTAVLENKMLAINLAKMKEIIEAHDKREQEMAAYLKSIDGERPAEGFVIRHAFENHEKRILEVTAEVARQFAETEEQLAAFRGLEQ